MLCFPETYDPRGFEIKLAGSPVRVSSAAHEAARAWHRYATRSRVDSVAERNFWRDWRAMLPAHLARLRLADFEFVNVDVARRPAGRGRSCLRVDAPGVFSGRGRHPSRGRYRHRIRPEDVTVNAALSPRPPRGHRWAASVADAEWVASWRDPVTRKLKYLYGDVGRHDEAKFDAARMLARRLPALRRAVAKDMSSGDRELAQTALAIALLDVLAVRVGGRGNAAGVAGVTTLQRRHVALDAGGATFEFVGKDAVRFRRHVKLDRATLAALGDAVARASPALFSDTDAQAVNARIGRLVPGATAKTFRTCHASLAFEAALAGGRSVDDARLAAASLLNHRRADGKPLPSTTVSNYIDPRIAFAFCKRTHTKPSAFFTRSQLVRFRWAADAPASFSFGGDQRSVPRP